MSDPKKTKVIVTGGCGYIGSHSIVDLLEAGHEVVSVDNNARSSPDVLEGVTAITGQTLKNHKVELCDPKATAAFFQAHSDAAAVIHFAAYKTVPESVQHPLRYYHNNLVSTINILEQMKKHDIPYLVFSSSCSVYGNVDELPVTEDTPLAKAVSPYGATKQMSEQMIEDFAQAHPARCISLRYFNPVGAHPSAKIGEIPHGDPENLFPIITETALGVRDQLTIYGDDYDTRDGTCIRDYIHVMDVARAHTLALSYLSEKKNKAPHEIYNLGTGQGVTVLEAVKAFEKATGQSLNYEIGSRRPGDVEAIYADNKKVKQRLNWSAEYTLEDMLRTAWEWDQKLHEK